MYESRGSCIQIKKMCSILVVLSINGCFLFQRPVSNPNQDSRQRVYKPVVNRIEVGPPEKPCDFYNDELKSKQPESDYQKWMYRRIQNISRNLNRTPPIFDLRLSLAADVVVQAMNSVDQPPAELVVFALVRHGIVESDFSMSGFELMGDLERYSEKIEELLQDMVSRKECNQIGFGSDLRLDSTRLGMVLCQPRRVETTPIPRHLDTLQPITVNAKLLKPFQQPAVYVTDATGQVNKIAVQELSDDGFSFHFSCGQIPGRYQLEILGNENDCPAVAANVPIWCNQEPQQSFSSTLEPWKKRYPSSPQEVEEGLLELINRDRQKHHLALLNLHAQAAEVALEHCRDMDVSQKVGHHSDRTGTPMDRAKKAGLQFGSLGENVGLGKSTEEIHEGLMKSPGHRHNILNPYFTHVGIGVVFGRGESEIPSVLVTELFIGPKPRPNVLAKPKVFRQTEQRATGSNESTNNPIRIRTTKKSVDGCRILGMRRQVQTIHKNNCCVV